MNPTAQEREKPVTPETPKPKFDIAELKAIWESRRTKAEKL